MLPSKRKLLAIQGFSELDDTSINELEPWVRFTPFVCTSLTVVGAALASAPFLLILAVIAAVGAASPVHPFDALFNVGVRHAVRGPRLPRNGPPRRFACGVAACWLIATAVTFEAGVDTAGYVLGGMLAGAMALVALLHVCIPSILYSALFARRVLRPQ